MTKKLSRLIFMIMVFLTISCIKDSYDMNMLSKKIHISPTLAISAIKGDISLGNLDIWSDTVLFDKNNLVKIIFKKDTIFNLTADDFYLYAKGSVDQMKATFDPYTLNLDIGDILSHITGDILISNPSIKLYYSNSFPVPVKIKFDATGKRKDKQPVSLNLDTFALSFPNAPELDITDSLTIDKSNSSLQDLISMPPEEIDFSGTAMLNPSGKTGQNDNYVLSSNRIIGRIEVEMPLEFRMNNLSFSDTVDNFLADAFDKESELNWEDFELFRIDFDVENGFPMGASLNMGLRDSVSLKVISSIDASELLKPAPVDGDGIATGVALSSTSITFTHDFFSSIKRADKIIFKFTLNTTDNGTKDVRIYSDYRIKFKAALVLKPDIKFNLK